MKEKNQWQLFRTIFSASAMQAVTNRKAFLFSFLASIASVDLFLALLEKNAPLSAFSDSLTLLSKEQAGTMIIFAIVFSSLSLFAKGALLFTAHASLERKRQSLKHFFSSAANRFPRYLAFELAIILSLTLIFLILTIPGTLSQENPVLSQNLFLLGTLVFLPILITGLLIEQFGSFYLLLSRVSIRSSLDLGAALFMKNIPGTLRFGGLFLLAFVGVNTAISATLRGLIPILPQNTTGIFIGLSIFYLCQSLLLAFSKFSWLGFFRSIAKDAGKETSLQMEESVIEKNVPELKENGESA